MSVLAGFVAALRVWKRERTEAERHDVNLRYQRIKSLADAARARKREYELGRELAEAGHRAAFWRQQGIEWRQTNALWRDNRPRWQNYGRPIYEPYKEGVWMPRCSSALPEVPPLDYPPFRFTRDELLAIRDEQILSLHLEGQYPESEAKRLAARIRDCDRKVRGKAFRRGDTLARLAWKYETVDIGSPCQHRYMVVPREDDFARDRITALLPNGQREVVFNDNSDR